MNTRVQLTNVLCIQNGTSQYDWPAGPPATPNKAETTAATTGAPSSTSPSVAVSNIEKASVADAAIFRLPEANKLPVGWEMGKTPDGVEELFVNTGAT